MCAPVLLKGFLFCLVSSTNILSSVFNSLGSISKCFVFLGFYFDCLSIEMKKIVEKLKFFMFVLLIFSSS